MPNRFGQKRFNYHDSGFEDDIANYLRSIGLEFGYESQQYTYRTPVYKGVCYDCGSEYTGQQRVYTPDFFLNNGIVIEGKGYMDASVRAKLGAFRSQYPRIDFRILFQTDQKIPRVKKFKTYSEWAKHHKIPFWICKKYASAKEYNWPPVEWFVNQWEG